MNKKILVAIHSGFIDTPAIQRAIALANTADVEIKLYSAVYDEYIPNIDVAVDDIEKTHELMLDSEKAKLKKIKGRLENIAKSVEIEAEWQRSPADGIANAAKQFNADLIMASSTRHSTLSRLFLSNTDWEILRHVPLPVLFAHNHEDKPYQKVIVAVKPAHRDDEPTKLEKQMLAVGKWICETFNAELHLAHAYPDHLPETSIEYMIPSELNTKLKQEHRDALYRLASKYDIDDENIHFLEDYPRTAMPKLATDLGADLVIMGIVSRNFIDRFLIGATAEYLLDHLECDVLTVHANNKEAI